MRIAVSYHDTVTKLQELALPAPGPFDRAEWFALLCQGGAPGLLALAESAEGSAALPLMRGGKRIEALRNWFSFTWRPLVSAQAHGEALLTALASDLMRQTHRIDLAPVPDEDGSATLLERSFRNAGWWTELVQCDDNHVVRLRGRDFAAFWEDRPGALRSTVKRKGGKVNTEISISFEQDVWDIYQEVYRNSWKPREGHADILERFARAEGEAGRLRLGLAYAEGRPVAAQLWTVENGTAYIHKLAHLEAAKPLSAGSVLSAAMFRHAIDEDRVELIDFGTGSDAYKRDWMEEVRPRFQLTALDPRQPRSWPALAKRRLARLARRIRAR